MRIACIVLIGGAVTAMSIGCGLAENYADADGPRYSGDYATGVARAAGPLRAITYNLKYGEDVDTAISVLSEPAMLNADLVLMQEMDADGVDRIAEALGMRYVYYPASVHHLGRDFGNAILTPWPIASDHKLLLPHHDPLNDRLRTATAAVVDVRGTPVLAYSIHLSVPTLGLGARLEQVATLIDDADAQTAVSSVVLGGDLNTGDPGSSEQTVALFGEHDIQWATSGAGTTLEYYGRCFTLDYVFSRGFQTQDTGVYRGDAGSDHQPMWVELAE